MKLVEKWFQAIAEDERNTNQKENNRTRLVLNERKFDRMRILSEKRRDTGAMVSDQHESCRKYFCFDSTV